LDSSRTDESADHGFPVHSSRKHSRTRCRWPAKIIVSAKAPPIPCLVVDISPGGAGLSLWVGSTFGIPRSFELEIEGNPIRCACRVAWMERNALGVEFQTPFSVPND
jgi:hypothetical protein